MKRAALILALGLSLGSGTFAQTFEDYFVDKTLRLDYIFMGNADKQDICLDELSVLPQWGRKTPSFVGTSVGGKWRDNLPGSLILSSRQKSPSFCGTLRAK